MKALIWIGCILCAGLVQLFLNYAGIIGAIPAMVVFGGMYASASFFCKKYEEKRSRKSITNLEGLGAVDTSPAPEKKEQAVVEDASLAPITYCRKCGKKLFEGSDFCSFCGTAIVKE